MSRFLSPEMPRLQAVRTVITWSLLVAAGATVTVSLMAKVLAQTAAVPVTPAPSASTSSTAVPADMMAHSCAACHGTNGQLGDEFFKPLAGMPVQQFVRTMTDFREGRRASTLMGHVARGFSDADLQGMAEFFAAQQPQTNTADVKGAQ